MLRYVIGGPIERMTKIDISEKDNSLVMAEGIWACIVFSYPQVKTSGITQTVKLACEIQRNKMELFLFDCRNAICDSCTQIGSIESEY